MAMFVFAEGKEIEEDLIKDDTSSLTRAQAAAVRKRVDTLNATIHKKQKQRLQYKTDVRDVFSPAAEVRFSLPFHPCMFLFRCRKVPLIHKWSCLQLSLLLQVLHLCSLH